MTPTMGITLASPWTLWSPQGLYRRLGDDHSDDDARYRTAQAGALIRRLGLVGWPKYSLFHQYLTQTARAAGHTLPGSKDMRTAYREFTKQHPRPIPATPPYAPTGSKHEPAPPVTGPVPPLTLLLAPNESKLTQTTVIHHGAKWCIPKHHMTARDLPKVPQDSQSMPRTCWACDPEAPTTPWPVLHLIARHHTHPTTHLPPQGYAWIAPWFHRTDTNPTVA